MEELCIHNVCPLWYVIIFCKLKFFPQILSGNSTLTGKQWHIQLFYSNGYHFVKVVNVTAEDKDGEPNGPPLKFILVDRGVGVDWRLEKTGGE